jgi:hypothetical protein
MECIHVQLCLKFSGILGGAYVPYKCTSMSVFLGDVFFIYVWILPVHSPNPSRPMGGGYVAPSFLESWLLSDICCDAALVLSVADPHHCWLVIGQVELCVVIVVVGSGLSSLSLKLT